MKENDLTLPSAEELEKLNQYENLFKNDCAAALKWIYRLQKWNGKSIEECIPGVKASVWRAYGQQSYKKQRSLHVVAAFSWLSQITMTAMYYGTRINEYWPGVNKEIIEIIVYSSLLPSHQFDYLLRQMIEKVKEKEFSHTEKIVVQLEHINTFRDSDFLIPKKLDIDDFKFDYYRSVSINLRKFRIANNLSVNSMAIVLNTTENRYRSFEDIENPVSIPLYFAMRLKLGFKIKNTVPFTDQMKKYSAFSTARDMQQLREQIIIDLISPLDEDLQESFRKLSYTVMQFHLS